MGYIEEFLIKRTESGLLRTLHPISWRYKGKIRLNDREYFDFSSNDYLGLSGHPKLRQASKSAIDKFGTAASASRLMSGDLEIHHLLEEKVARFKNKEAAIVFNSGYQANIGIISALYGKTDYIFSDRLNHASIIDGILLSGAHFFRFRHNDPGHLEILLKKERDKFKDGLIITESIFSMEGDRSCLRELVRLKEKYNCKLMVDEAHATGVFGKNGSGLIQEDGLEKEVDFVMGTFSKALAGFGGYLATSRKVADYLVNACRSFIYSTALPPAIIATNLASIKLISEEPWRRKKLLGFAAYFRNTLKERGFSVRGSSQIVPLIVGDNIKAQGFASFLQEKGYWVFPIKPPTVPNHQARLRFSLTVYHDKNILQRLIDDICAARF